MWTKNNKSFKYQKHGFTKDLLNIKTKDIYGLNFINGFTDDEFYNYFLLKRAKRYFKIKERLKNEDKQDIWNSLNIETKQDTIPLFKEIALKDKDIRVLISAYIVFDMKKEANKLKKNLYKTKNICGIYRDRGSCICQINEYFNLD